VLEACDGAEAMEIAEVRDRRIDLLLTDVVMPYMRGTELAERIRKIRPDVEVLLMSGYLQEAAQAADGATQLHVIRKPYRAEQLADRVARILNAATTRS
jgi:two-component system cell cycle sensor histidine kinase/response regulator CckA